MRPRYHWSYQGGLGNRDDGGQRRSKHCKIDSPAGRVTAYADVKDGEVERVRFQNVPCFVYKENITVQVDGIGDVIADVAYCGAFYVYLDAKKSVSPLLRKIRKIWLR